MSALRASQRIRETRQQSTSTIIQGGSEKATPKVCTRLRSAPVPKGVQLIEIQTGPQIKAKKAAPAGRVTPASRPPSKPSTSIARVLKTPIQVKPVNVSPEADNSPQFLPSVRSSNSGRKRPRDDSEENDDSVVVSPRKRRALNRTQSFMASQQDEIATESTTVDNEVIQSEDAKDATIAELRAYASQADTRIAELKRDVKRLQAQVGNLQASKSLLAAKLGVSIDERSPLGETVELPPLKDNQITRGVGLMADSPRFLVEGEQFEVNAGVITCGDVLGTGGTSSVIAATLKRSERDTPPELIVIKSVNREPGQGLDAKVRREILALEKFSPLGVTSRHITTIEARNCFAIVMERHVTTLWDVLEQYKSERGSKGIPANLIQDLAHELTLLLDQLHRIGWTHRDIKPDNILVTKSGRLLLSDMGIAGPVSAVYGGYYGTEGFIPPEIANKQPEQYTNLAHDVWALGATLLWMAGTVLENQNDPRKASQKKLNKVIAKAFPQQPNARDFVQKCLQKNPKKRMTLQQALEHSWIANCPSGFPEEGPWMNICEHVPRSCSLAHVERPFVLDLGPGPYYELEVVGTPGAS
ncbi:SubName: Full=Uncharacterized protein {ECO:0000313/EMBL:CCA70256.1} [Serendipita indica DSM 11827]|nr:SubName: Full=Uncharacterized protein {ECO:0000313/EMBL:CCA70256.1} [Serendipita indica DSM 11827]